MIPHEGDTCEVSVSDWPTPGEHIIEAEAGEVDGYKLLDFTITRIDGEEVEIDSGKLPQNVMHTIYERLAFP